MFQVWGANTDVGKTVFSACLLSVDSLTFPSIYVKPVQSGYPKDDDSKFVTTYATNIAASTLYTYEEAVSPDLAARRLQSMTTENVVVPDTHILQSLSKVLKQFRHDCIQANTHSSSIALIETAGGILSPSPQGNLQADTYKPLRLPAILIGDNKLGGISTTLTAYETLRSRGYDIPVVVLFQNQGNLHLENESSIQKHLDNSQNEVPLSFSDTKVFQAPPLPELSNRNGGGGASKLDEYLKQSETVDFFENLLQHLKNVEKNNLNDIKQMINDSNKYFWYPFTQHCSSSLPSSKVNNIYFDSAHDDSIITYTNNDNELMSLKQQEMVDAMGSWWTNGVGHGNVSVANSISYAASRYGHVMFAEAVSKPSIELARKLLTQGGPGENWATRVFFSDNGSTAMEVALKMAMRKRKVDTPDRNHINDVRVITLSNSYHGDTLGVMDCSEESDFNKLQTPWYKPRCITLEPSTIFLRNGVWTLSTPNWLTPPHSDGTHDELEHEEFLIYSSIDELFKERCTNNLHQEEEYEGIIGKFIDEKLSRNEFDIGGLIIEPILQGAGGMNLIDPSFQRALIKACRQRQIPVVFDEVFTGFYRLGDISASKILGIDPDIASYSKLLTGGAVPLAVTLAREEVLKAFDGESKREALLHGHSYTAHAVGCSAAVQSLQIYEKKFRHHEPQYHSQQEDQGRPKWWDESLAREISSMKTVERVIIMGTVMAVEIKSDGNEGYAAVGSKEVVKRLAEYGIFARPLGNVVYMMCTPLSSQEVCQDLSGTLVKVLESMEDEDGQVQNRW